MTREELLKNHILTQYRSIREFCMQMNIPYSTVDNLLKKDLGQSSVSLVIRICDRLGIDIDALIEGEIKEKKPQLEALTLKERALILAYRNNSAMQGAVDKLLGLSSDTPTVGEDIATTVTAAFEKSSARK